MPYVHGIITCEVSVCNANDAKIRETLKRKQIRLGIKDLYKLLRVYKTYRSGAFLLKKDHVSLYVDYCLPKNRSKRFVCLFVCFQPFIYCVLHLS